MLVAAVALAVVLTQRSGDQGGSAGSGGEVFLQNAAAVGPDPFTKSTATRTGAATAPPASLPPRTSSATPEVSGATPGLYGGTLSVASCDVERQVRYLSDAPAKNAAFASVVGVSPTGVPGYLRSLTPLQLRADTRVTNHGYRDGAATSYQAVLQAGTAVLVDSHGMPRVRCACGNPLTGPVAQKAPRTTGTPWAGYRADQVVAVAPSPTVVTTFVVYDPQDRSWFARQDGDTGRHDEPTSRPTASPSVSAPASPSVSPSGTPSSPEPCTAPSPCPTTPTATAPESAPTTAPPTTPPTAPPPAIPPTSQPPPPSTPPPPTESAPATQTSAQSPGPEPPPTTAGPLTAA
ncbi:hypothetical protein BU197_10280 [Streptomyces sp. CBMA291]|nr:MULTISPECIES: DUF6777 domain-containing protein [unclassified Streptomyces]MBD0708772.1 hypothetical protein [Streptomyces sp. CBMA291]MBD0714710.1 hypothetical protein [Streptomyces sp. CBMA370]